MLESKREQAKDDVAYIGKNQKTNRKGKRKRDRHGKNSQTDGANVTCDTDISVKKSNIFQNDDVIDALIVNVDQASLKQSDNNSDIIAQNLAPDLTECRSSLQLVDN